MNKMINLGTVALSLLVSPLAFADEPTGPTVWDGFSGFLTPDWNRDFSMTVGAKMWLNEWSRERTFFFSLTATEDSFPESILLASDTAPDAQESEIEPVPIPQLSVRYKWLFVTGSYYSKTRFHFGKSSAFVKRVFNGDFDNPVPVSFTNSETSAERYEWDTAAGIYVHPYVAILSGYKKVRQEIDTTFEVIHANGTDSTTSDELLFSFREFDDIVIEGPTIGIAASVPIGRGFGVYATYSHGFMDTDTRTTLNVANPGASFADRDSTYDVAESGFSYTHGLEGLMPHMPLSAATAYAGYRYQRISTDFDQPEVQDARDVTQGFAVGVNLTF